MIEITTIQPNEKNPRRISDAKLEKLKQSISEFEKMMELRPIIIDDNNVILGGNMRFRALTELGYTELPDEWVKKASGLTEEDKKRFIIEDNLPFGEWAWELLDNDDWDKSLLTDWGLDLPNYHTINDFDTENFDEFKPEVNAIDEDTYRLNITFDDEIAMKDFMEFNDIILDNNYKRVGNVVSIHYPLQERRDVKNLKFE